ncbi:IS3 family transposase [Corynebacterium sp.]|uniref:IS3 family transposase n=1 Tax=Corynebacterium sp. TaxID=1720 RepID=UPI003735ED3C
MQVAFTRSEASSATFRSYNKTRDTSFWSTLKTEFYDRRTWQNRDQARRAVAHWIEAFYNRQRRHSSLRYVSPCDLEKAKVEGALIHGCMCAPFNFHHREF